MAQHWEIYLGVHTLNICTYIHTERHAWIDYKAHSKPLPISLETSHTQLREKNRLRGVI